MLKQVQHDNTLIFFRPKVLLKGTCQGYSNKQHRGNEGEGQFHLNQDNLTFHREKYLQKTMTYEELYELFMYN